MGFVPKPFEIVIFAGFGGEDVDDEITKVHKHPARFGAAFDGAGEDTAVFLRVLSNPIGNRAQLAFICAIAQKKIIGKNCLLA